MIVKNSFKASCLQLYENYLYLAKNKKEVHCFGFCRQIRESKNVVFIELNDGSSLNNVQLVIKKNDTLSEISSLAINTSIYVKGVVQLTLKRKQQFEIQVEELKIVNVNQSTYPLQNKEQTFEFLREIQEYRLVTKQLQYLHRLKQVVSNYFLNYFEKNNYMWVQTPILTTNDAEGGGEVFQVISKKNSFFSKDAYLTVSGQLNAEICAQAFHKVYTFGPTFRAEKSDTPFHAAEFWMIEPEISFFNMLEMIDEIKETLHYIVSHIYHNYKHIIDYFSEITNIDLTNRLDYIIRKDYEWVTYKNALVILTKAKNIDFQYKDFSFGISLQKEHEQYLCEYYNKPIIITNYPLNSSPFYMYDNGDGTTRSFDFIFPKIGEIIGGSQREDRYDLLRKQIEKKSSLASLEWYLNMRKHGYAFSTGYGIGLERFIMYLSGIKNIREVLLFPRSYKQIRY